MVLPSEDLLPFASTLRFSIRHLPRLLIQHKCFPARWKFGDGVSRTLRKRFPQCHIFPQAQHRVC